MKDKNILKDILKNVEYSKTYSFPALVYSSDLAKDKNGNDYLKLRLVAGENSVDARKWNASKEDISKLSAGNLILFSGYFKKLSWNDIVQFNIQKIEREENEKLLSEFLPQPATNISSLKEDFFYFLQEIKDEDYKKIIKYIFDDEKLLKDFCKVRAGLWIHHNVNGGLLWHTVSMLKIAKSILPIYSYLQIDQSLLYAGIIMHDFGKIEEIGSDFYQKEYSLKGKLLGHIVIASNKIAEIGKILQTPEHKINLLQHLVLSSHGKLENGSAREPLTTEALILSMIDNLDAKINMLFNNLKNIDTNQWTSKFNLNSQSIAKPVSFWNHFPPKEKK